jgi:TetR/AcrR family transcriptional regulator, transcriptional repressor for nem operon
MKSLKARQKEASRDNILKAAAHLFREKGFHATGVDQLMEKAGLTAGAFYAHFKSKEDLLLEVLKYSLEKNRGRLLEGTSEMKPDQMVETVLSRYVSELHRDHPKAGCPLPAVGSEIHRHSPQSEAIVSQYLQEWIGIFEKSGAVDREKGLRLLCQAVGAILLSRMVESKLSNEILQAARKVN